MSVEFFNVVFVNARKDTTATDYTTDLFFFNDFNDGKYPRYYENNATTFWGPFSLIGLFFVVKCLGSQNELLSLVVFSGGFQGRLHKDIKVIESKLRGK